MKRLLLIAAVAAPLAVMADDATTPVQDQPIIGYDFPAGTFFTTTGIATGETTGEGDATTTAHSFDPSAEAKNIAILPWGGNIVITNTSIFQGQPYTDANWWWNAQIASGSIFRADQKNTTNYTYTGSYTIIPANYLPLDVPLVYEGVHFDEEGKPTDDNLQYKWMGNDAESFVVFGGIPTDNYAPIAGCTVYNPAPAFATLESAASTAFKTFNGEADALWSNLYSYEYPTISLQGVAQYIAYPGRPYEISAVTINTAQALPVGDVFTVSIYEATDELTTLPAEPIVSTDFTVTEQDANTTSYAVDLLSRTTITTPVYIVFHNIGSESFQPKVMAATAKADCPEPANQGLMGVVSTTASYDEPGNTLLAYTEADENGLPVALDMTVDMKYVFLYPYQESNTTYDSSLGTRPTWQFGQTVDIKFDRSKNWSIIDTKSSSAASDITFTLEDGSEIPAWLSASATAVNGKANEVAIEFYTIYADVKASAVVIASTPDGAIATFNISADTTNAIDAVISDAEVVAREYYDLAGRRLNEAPVRGFFIEKAIRADGTTTSTSRMN